MLPDLIRYTEVADARYIEAFINAGNSIPKAEALFSHILNSQHVWLSRINGIKPEYKPWDIHPVADFKELHTKNIAEMNRVATQEDLDKIISYSTFTGDRLENTVRDILLHITNHSGYHRGQVASLLKQNNVQPPVTDLIVLKREGVL
ncbi:MAG: DinB family protein [Sphingobacteriaceae bacterium]|nr:DinB family protein [Sphingobacteriaceae bacterium]